MKQTVDITGRSEYCNHKMEEIEVTEEQHMIDAVVRIMKESEKNTKSIYCFAKGLIKRNA